MEKKNIPIRVPVGLHLEASKRMLTELGEINFQRFVIQALESFVAGVPVETPLGAEANVSVSKKERQQVEDFLEFLHSTNKEDVHTVLSLMARFSGSAANRDKAVSERNVNRR